jgi:hypothetical protein
VAIVLVTKVGYVYLPLRIAVARHYSARLARDENTLISVFCWYPECRGSSSFESLTIVC